MPIGNNMRDIRVLRGLTQERLAKKAGLSRCTIVNFETGRRVPRVDDLAKIAEVMRVDVTVFFKDAKQN